MGRKVEVAGIMGPVWFIGWLFTIGFLKLSFFHINPHFSAKNGVLCIFKNIIY